MFFHCCGAGGGGFLTLNYSSPSSKESTKSSSVHPSVYLPLPAGSGIPAVRVPRVRWHPLRCPRLGGQGLLGRGVMGGGMVGRKGWDAGMQRYPGSHIPILSFCTARERRRRRGVLGPLPPVYFVRGGRGRMGANWWQIPGQPHRQFITFLHCPPISINRLHDPARDELSPHPSVS